MDPLGTFSPFAYPFATEDKVETLLSAAGAGDLDKVIEQLDIEKVHIDSKGGYLEETALHNAAISGQVAVCDYLIKKGCDVNATDIAGRTALHEAALKGHSQTCSLLIDAGLNVNTTDDTGDTALHEVAEKGHAEICSILLKYGCDVNVKGTFGKTPLHYAAFRDHAEICSLLLKSGCPIDVKDRSGETPLMVACDWNKTNTVEFLLQNKANVSIVNDSGNSALHIVAERGNGDLANKLFEHGASLELQNKNGFIPEVVAQMKGHKQLANHLAELRKQKDKEDKEEDEYFNAPTPLPPMTPGTFELILEDDDVADLVDSDIPDTDDSIQPSTSGNFSQHDFAVPRHTSLPSSNTTSSSLHTDFNFAIPTHPVPTSGQAGLPTKVKDKSDELLVEQLKLQLAAEKRKNAEKDKHLEGKKQKLSEKEDKIKQQSDTIEGKGRIMKQQSDTIEGKGRIMKQQSETIQGKGRIIKQQSDTIEGKKQKLSEKEDKIKQQSDIIEGKERTIKQQKHKIVQKKKPHIGKILYETNDEDSSTIIEKTEQNLTQMQYECSTSHSEYNRVTAAEFCNPSTLRSTHTITTREDMVKTQNLMKYVCQISFGAEQIKATGFVLDFTRNVNDQKDYCFIATCEHVLSQGLEQCLAEGRQPCQVIFNRHGANSVLPVAINIKEIVFSETEYDYAILCLEYNEDLNIAFMKTGLCKYISALSQIKRLHLIGHADGNIMQHDLLTMVSKDTMRKEITYSQARKDNRVVNPNNSQVNESKGTNLHFLDLRRPEYFVFYECKSYHGSSGSPCFVYNNVQDTIELVCMHRAGIYSTNTNIQAGDPCDYGIGVLMTEVKSDIQNKIEQSAEWQSVL